jgi:hypothetical protein
MTANPIADNTLTFHPVTVVVSAWDQNRTTPGTQHYLGVTIANRGDWDAVVQVRLESPSDLLRQWCAQPEQWLALSSGKSGELTFCLDVPGDALPQWLNYEVVVSPQGAYADYYLPPTRCRLQILAPEVSETAQDPTFSLTPLTTPDRPLMVQLGTPVIVELMVENRSERVDRFRLDCTGLPEDWGIQIEYPREADSFGLVRLNDSLGVNPGDRGMIRVLLQPPSLPLAGSYLPSFRLASENDPRLGLLALIYLQVDPVYRLQSQLETVQDQVRGSLWDGGMNRHPAQFILQFANLGNTPRQVQLTLKPKTPDACTYSLSSDRVTIAPQAVSQIPLEGTPQRWWTRPWFGSGKIYPFQVELSDRDRHPINPPILPGQLIWMPRPWWQLLLTLLAGLGLLGALAFLIWWYFLRPPTPPTVVEFAAEDSRYAEASGDMARVRWQIENPEQIQTLKLTGSSPEGTLLSGPLIYEFKDGKPPAALQSFCTQEQTMLTCSQVRTDAFLPGKYVFELTLTPKGRRATPVTLKTNPIEITAQPPPTVTALVPKSLIYREAVPGTPTPAEKAIPAIDQSGIRLDWAVTMPANITALHLVGRDRDGKMIGDRWFEFSQPGELPKLLSAFCEMGQTLICRNVPTGLTAVGEYRFELQAISAEPSIAEVKPRVSEIVKIQPKTPQILSFQINGQEAPAKLLIPIAPLQRLLPIQISWRVQGGSTTRVVLMPSPGSVPLSGRVSVPLSPQGNTTIALQVTAPTGELLTRSVTLETYDPTRSKPAASSPIVVIPPSSNGTMPSGAPTPIAPAGSSRAPSGAPGESPAQIGVPAPVLDDRLAPSEDPPQFNR